MIYFRSDYSNSIYETQGFSNFSKEQENFKPSLDFHKLHCIFKRGKEIKKIDYVR
jgi:hypothetical protein